MSAVPLGNRKANGVRLVFLHKVNADTTVDGFVIFYPLGQPLGSEAFLVLAASNPF